MTEIAMYYMIDPVYADPPFYVFVVFIYCCPVKLTLVFIYSFLPEIVVFQLFK